MEERERQTLQKKSKIDDKPQSSKGRGLLCLSRIMEMERRMDMIRRKYNISTLKNMNTMHLGCWFDKGNQPMIKEEENLAQEDSNYDLILLMVTTISHESCNLEGWFLVKGNHD